MVSKNVKIGVGVTVAVVVGAIIIVGIVIGTKGKEEEPADPDLPTGSDIKGNSCSLLGSQRAKAMFFCTPV